MHRAPPVAGSAGLWVATGKRRVRGTSRGAAGAAGHGDVPVQGKRAAAALSGTAAPRSPAPCGPSLGPFGAGRVGWYGGQVSGEAATNPQLALAQAVRWGRLRGPGQGRGASGAPAAESGKWEAAGQHTALLVPSRGFGEHPRAGSGVPRCNVPQRQTDLVAASPRWFLFRVFVTQGTAPMGKPTGAAGKALPPERPERRRGGAAVS